MISNKLGTAASTVFGTCFSFAVFCKVIGRWIARIRTPSGSGQVNAEEPILRTRGGALIQCKSPCRIRLHRPKLAPVHQVNRRLDMTSKVRLAPARDMALLVHGSDRHDSHNPRGFHSEQPISNGRRITAQLTGWV